jgi:hypothetical protein
MAVLLLLLLLPPPLSEAAGTDSAAAAVVVSLPFTRLLPTPLPCRLCVFAATAEGGIIGIRMFKLPPMATRR